MKLTAICLQSFQAVVMRYFTFKNVGVLKLTCSYFNYKGILELRRIEIELFRGKAENPLCKYKYKNIRLFTEPLAKYYFKQLIEAVGYMHENGFAHKDLKFETWTKECY